MLAELANAFVAIVALTIVVGVIYVLFTDLPFYPFLLGEAFAAPTAIIMLMLASPRRRR